MTPASILENELVKKYFQYSPSGTARTHTEMAFCILNSMQQPIQKGDHILRGNIIEKGIWTFDETYASINPFLIRLPDAFQPKSEEKKECEPVMTKCESCGYEASIHMPKQGNTVRFDLHKPTATPFYGCNETDHSLCRSCKPDSAVEEQIQKMVKQFQPRIDGYENELRELVRLARAEDK